MNSKFKIERSTVANESGWTQSSSDPNTSTSREAQDIVANGNASEKNQKLDLRYRAVLVPEPVKYIVEVDTKYVSEGVWDFRQSFNDSKEYDTYSEAAAAVRVQQQKPAALKGNTHYRVGTIGVPEPEVTVYVVDMREVERRVLAGLIADEDVQKLLPFKTRRVWGNTYVHIENASLYDVSTNHHTIGEGDTICFRSGETRSASRKGLVPTCPGCLAKAKRIIVDHILGER